MEFWFRLCRVRKTSTPLRGPHGTISRLLKESGKQLFFLRPRRFGKGLLSSMLENTTPPTRRIASKPYSEGSPSARIPPQGITDISCSSGIFPKSARWAMAGRSSARSTAISMIASVLSRTTMGKYCRILFGSIPRMPSPLSNPRKRRWIDFSRPASQMSHHLQSTNFALSMCESCLVSMRGEVSLELSGKAGRFIRYIERKAKNSRVEKRKVTVLVDKPKPGSLVILSSQKKKARHMPR